MRGMLGAGIAGLLLIAGGCEPGADRQPGRAGVDQLPPILASNAFLYYADLQGAWRFYEKVLGLETVSDFGFAKIMRVANTSYLTLVDAARGMHSADEPKTVAIALVTDELEGWYEYLQGTGARFRNPLSVREGSAHDGFVVYDPEGYLLEFERFNSHQENERLAPRLAIDGVYPVEESLEPARRGLGFKATVLWMYYRDLAAAQRFYEDVMGLELIADQGWTKIYSMSTTGYIGLVDEQRGMHSFTEDKAVTASFLVGRIEPWLDYLGSWPEFEFRSAEIGNESDRVQTFVGYDPENYFLEFDTFLDAAGNERLLELLGQ